MAQALAGFFMPISAHAEQLRVFSPNLARIIDNLQSTVSPEFDHAMTWQREVGRLNTKV
jgi:hypothetical protein